MAAGLVAAPFLEDPAEAVFGEPVLGETVFADTVFTETVFRETPFVEAVPVAAGCPGFVFGAVLARGFALGAGVVPGVGPLP